MGKFNLSDIGKNVVKVFNKHDSTIMVGIGIGAMITTTILAVKATPKALEKIEEKKKEVFNNLDPVDTPSHALPSDVKLKATEIVSVTWKYYVPAVITGIAGVVLLIGADRVNVRRNAALIAAYNVSNTALNEYKAKVIEAIGEKKEKKIHEEVSKETLARDPISQSNKPIFVTGNGNVRFYDIMNGRRFDSDRETLRKIENNLNRRMRDEMYVSLNDLYFEIGLDPVQSGDVLGWCIDKGYIEMVFDTMMDDDGVPCVVLDYLVRPYAGYAV